MKRFFLFILLILTIYIAKPLWEKPVSQYVDLTFLEPIDEKFETFLTSDSIAAVVHYINDATDEAIHFVLSKTIDKDNAIEDVEKPALTKPEKNQISIHNIELGTAEDTVTSTLGEPTRRSMNEYGTEWMTYHQEYHNFLMVSYDENRLVNAIYTNDDLIASDTGIEYGTAKSVVRETYGEPLTEIRKGLNIYLLHDSEGFDLFDIGDMYAYIFYDLHQNETITAVQLIAKSLEQQKSGVYTQGDPELREGFEVQLFDLTNAARVRHGLPFLDWEADACWNCT